MPPTVFQCDECNTILGNCHGRQLFVGAVVFDMKPVTLRCHKCGKAKTWYPPKENLCSIGLDVTKCGL